ncbi:MAG: hypothetical protein M1838_003275 [Thelocarpon superellum]|nr:MAG: hypothetical protein M1838_003275 [Thelocarpon superellum]
MSYAMSSSSTHYRGATTVLSRGGKNHRPRDALLIAVLQPELLGRGIVPPTVSRLPRPPQQRPTRNSKAWKRRARKVSRAAKDKARTQATKRNTSTVGILSDQAARANASLVDALQSFVQRQAARVAQPDSHASVELATKPPHDRPSVAKDPEPQTSDQIARHAEQFVTFSPSGESAPAPTYLSALAKIRQLLSLAKKDGPPFDVTSVKIRKIQSSSPETQLVRKVFSESTAASAVPDTKGKAAPKASDRTKKARPTKGQKDGPELPDALTIDQALRNGGALQRRGVSLDDIKTVEATSLKIEPLHVEQPEVPSLAYGLERVLFNPGVYHLQDPRSKVFNFDPYLQKIMPVAEFDFQALKEYITSSRDSSLKTLAEAQGKKYVGSSSSMTTSLSHFHFLLSQWRPINTDVLSQGFTDRLRSFTQLQRKPSAIFLRWKDGTYAIDADKEYDSANILSMLGKSMEKLLTLPTHEYERYRRSAHGPGQVSEEERREPESFHYCTAGDFLMRSQLDARDARLPGTGMFDLKTRAVVAIRMDAQNYEKGRDYEIRRRYGEWESYEREYFDMIRAAFLKYSLQVRMGRMDGIFVAFHNTQRIFGFQYISLPEMDNTLHGAIDTTIGDQEFKLSLDLFNKILNRATEKFPQQSLRIHLETRESKTPFMYVFVEPVTEQEVDDIQNRNKGPMEQFERDILGLQPEAPANDEAGTNGTSKAAWRDIHAEVEQELVHDELLSNTSQQPDQAEDDPGSGANGSMRGTTSGIDTVAEIEPQHDAPTAAADAEVSRAVEDSEAAGDGKWLDEVDKDQQELRCQSHDRPILAMTLTIRNKVNGQYVIRPETLQESDLWSVEYALAEIQTQTRAWSLYRACRERRKKALDSADEDGADAAANFYVRRLWEMSKKGKKWRRQQDLADAENETEPVVLDHSSPRKAPSS